MQSRIPRQSEGVDLDARFSAEVAAAVSGARRRAVRDGDRQIDTAHLLHSLLESDAEARALLGDGPLLARLLGYLVQRSIGYGLRWRGAVEDSGAVPAVSGVAGYSPLAAAAVETACARAARRGAGRTGWDVERRCARADAVDLDVPDRYEGAVLDVGRGPGRLVQRQQPAVAAAQEQRTVSGARGGGAGVGDGSGGDGGEPAGAPCGDGHAIGQAGRAGQVCGADLLAALVADPQARAVEVLARAAVEPREVLDRVDRYFGATP